MSDYVQRNAESRARLASLCQRISDEQLARIAFGDWTVSAVLAHMAFWDRVTLERWNAFVKERQPVIQLPELLNTVGAADWRAMPPRETIHLVLDAADALDKTIEGLPDDLIEASRAAMGNPRMFERFHHREDHLSSIEKVI
jgi:uncharacterized damage-inducible protein DinB